MVLVKMLVLLFLSALRFYFVSPAQMTPTGSRFNRRAGGTFAGAVVFFAYIGFDAVRPWRRKRRIPSRSAHRDHRLADRLHDFLRASGGSVHRLGALGNGADTGFFAGRGEALTMALETSRRRITWPQTIVAAGSVVAHTAVLLVFQRNRASSCRWRAMVCCPSVFASIHPKFKTPHVTTILTGVFVGGIAAFANIESMLSLTNIGTLFAFLLVCIGVPILRHKDPLQPRPFRVPFGDFLMPLLGAHRAFSHLLPG